MHYIENCEVLSIKIIHLLVGLCNKSSQINRFGKSVFHYVCTSLSKFTIEVIEYLYLNCEPGLIHKGKSLNFEFDD